jgi:pimeloyl-ACP methyl ester carboxylesterase
VPRYNVGHFKSERARVHFLSVYRAAMAQLPPVSESTDVPTSFGTVRAYRFDGPSAGPPVVLLPGRNASTPMWRVNIPALLEHRTVVGIDLMGEAGMSLQDKPITGPDDEAQWLDDTLVGLGLDRVHVLGVSIGGWTAVNYAVRRRSRRFWCPRGCSSPCRSRCSAGCSVGSQGEPTSTNRCRRPL